MGNKISVTSEPKKSRLRKQALEYLDRAEQVKGHVDQQKEVGKYHEQIHIGNDSIGHSYQRVFGPFLDGSVTSVTVEDAYIRQFHQVHNFLRLCELLVKMCKNLKVISLITTLQTGDVGKQQIEHFQELKKSLGLSNITLTVQDSQTLHDREIRLNNGWIIKIGRGLDYFKAPSGKFSIGYSDFDLRRCHETTVDIFHDNNLKNNRS